MAQGQIMVDDRRGGSLPLNGKRYYEAAISITDSHPGVRFIDALIDDFSVSQVERKYFCGEYIGLELMGWGELCCRMREEGQEEWLERIIALDEDVLRRTAERRLIRGESKEDVDMALKALSGLAGSRKISGRDKESGVELPIRARAVIELPDED